MLLCLVGVSVVIPVASAASTLDAAVGCISGQTHANLEILLSLNGSDAATESIAERLARTDSRIRILHAHAASTARALNAAITAASHPLIARMDADDWCPADRIARQVAWLNERPQIAAAGCAYHRALPDGTIVGTVRPPTDPARLRWALLFDNCFCHGSMLLRRDALLAVGGYDERLDRAQDYDLWLRMSLAHKLANMPDVLYRHTVPGRDQAGVPSPEQARVVADRMLAAWASLPPLTDAGAQRRVHGALARANAGGSNAADAARSLETALDDLGPTREAFAAWLVARAKIGVAPARVAIAALRSRLRETGAALRAAGHSSVWIWGAGSHTARLLDCSADLAMPVAGIIDDHLAGTEFRGNRVRSPATVPDGAAVLLSSDVYEDELWEASAPLRARAVRVARLYADGSPP